MVSKKILGAAIAAALVSQGALAVMPGAVTLDLDADTGALSYATEAVYTVASGYTTVNTQIAGPVNGLTVSNTVKSGVTANNQIYIRYDLTNAKFVTAVTPADLTFAAGTAAAPVQAPLVAVQSGGGAGQSYVIFQVTAQANAADRIDQANLAQLSLGSVSLSTTANATVAYAAYDTASSAVNQTAANKLGGADYASALKWASGFSTAFSASDVVADVSTGFTTFLTSGATAKIGTVKLGVDTTVRKADGTFLAALGDVIQTTTKIKMGGDNSFGTWGLGASAATSVLAVCGVGPSIPFIDDAAVAGTSLDTITAASTTVNTYHAVCVDNTAANNINTGSYTLSVTPVALTGALSAPSQSSGNLGSISKNGTTIQVAYLTTYADYTQRLVLVNRGSTAAPYSVSFRPENGKAVVAGSLATGTIPAGKTLILPVRQDAAVTAGLIDSVNAGTTTTRTAATVTVTAQSANIDAATTIVNATDKATDTVKLQ